jgi:hypothetical protein
MFQKLFLQGLAFSRAANAQLWVCLLEKAYAKAHGSYRAISGGHIAEALLDLTGAPPPKKINMSSYFYIYVLCCYICVLYVSSYYYICVLVLLYVSSYYYYVCVLILTLLDLTGAPTFTINFDEIHYNHDKLWAQLVYFKSQGFPMGCATGALVLVAQGLIH